MMRKAKGQTGKERTKRDHKKQRQYKFDEDRFRDDMSRALQGTHRFTKTSKDHRWFS